MVVFNQEADSIRQQMREEEFIIHEVLKKSKELDDNSNVLKTLEEKLGGLDWYENYLLDVKSTKSQQKFSGDSRFMDIYNQYKSRLEYHKQLLSQSSIEDRALAAAMQDNT